MNARELADWITAHWGEIKADFCAGITEAAVVKHYVRICALGADADSARWLQEAVDKYRKTKDKQKDVA